MATTFMNPEDNPSKPSSSPTQDMAGDETFSELEIGTFETSKLTSISLKDATIRNCTLLRVSIHNSKILSSTLTDCILIDCKLENSTNTKSNITNCRISHHSKITDSTMIKSTTLDSNFLNSSLKESKTTRSEILNSRIAQCPEIRFCQIDQSTCSASAIFNSTMTKTKIVGTEIYESQYAECAMKDCVFETLPLAIRRFPLEIRLMIFEEAIEWDGKTPNLIKALRGDQELYGEAMKILYKNCAFTLSERNYETRKEMPLKLYETIQRMVIDPEVRHDPPPAADEGLRVDSTPHLKELHYNCESGHDAVGFLLTGANHATQFLRTIERVSITFREPGINAEWAGFRETCIVDIISWVNAGLRVKGKLEAVTSKISEEETWFWQAGKDEILEWIGDRKGRSKN